MNEDPNAFVVEAIERIIGSGGDLSKEERRDLGEALVSKVEKLLQKRRQGRSPKTLYISEVGKPCRRQLWYDLRNEYNAEKLTPHTLFKFMYGDLIEEVVLFLAKKAGLDVRGEQVSVERKLKDGWVIRGRQDAIINDNICDVKSASTRSFQKFKDGTLAFQDPFGYLTQLDEYDTIGTSHTGRQPFFLAVDKQNGTMITYTPNSFPNIDYDKLVDDVSSDTPPPRSFTDEEFGKSGNRVLCMECSYCGYKQVCWPGLRVFNYSNRPVFFTKVVREPQVPEMTPHVHDTEET